MDLDPDEFEEVSTKSHDHDAMESKRATERMARWQQLETMAAANPARL